MKYNFSELGASHHNPFLGLMVELNDASNGVFVYALLILFFIISLYSILRTTNDIAKSYIFSLHIVLILSILLYYMARLEGYSLISNLVMLGLIMLEIVSVTAIYFMRNRGS